MRYMLLKELPGYEIGTCFRKSTVRINDWNGGLLREVERNSWDITKPLEDDPYVAIDEHSGWLFDLLQREHSNKQWFRALLERDKRMVCWNCGILIKQKRWHCLSCEVEL